MNWNKHLELEGQHAFLSPSQSAWINYTPDKLAERYYNVMVASLRGTRLHAYASEAIKLGIKQKSTNRTLNCFINDAIGFKMESELILKYSENCFGTADAISFRKNKLRIHDLKTGVTPAHMTQLEVYAALFCLEYDQNPADIEMELRIYQNDEIIIHIPEAERIIFIMNTIKAHDRIIENINNEELFRYE